jgi:hypothetical protein
MVNVDQHGFGHNFHLPAVAGRQGRLNAAHKEDRGKYREGAIKSETTPRLDDLTHRRHSGGQDRYREPQHLVWAFGDLDRDALDQLFRASSDRESQGGKN